MASVMIRLFSLTMVLAFVAACGSQANSTSVTDVCRFSDKSSVRVEGYLRLPIAVDVVVREPVKTEEHLLIIVENINGTGAFVTTSVSTTKNNEPNKIAALPMSYTYDDLHIYSNSGKQITADDRVNVTGEVSKSENGCVLKISKIETQ